MVLSIFGSLILLGAVGFLEWKQNGEQRPLWHWIALAISILVVAALIVLWVGEYRLEKASFLTISTDPPSTST